MDLIQANAIIAKGQDNVLPAEWKEANEVVANQPSSGVALFKDDNRRSMKFIDDIESIESESWVSTLKKIQGRSGKEYLVYQHPNKTNIYVSTPQLAAMHDKGLIKKNDNDEFVATSPLRFAIKDGDIIAS